MIPLFLILLTSLPVKAAFLKLIVNVLLLPTKEGVTYITKHSRLQEIPIMNIIDKNSENMIQLETLSNIDTFLEGKDLDTLKDSSMSDVMYLKVLSEKTPDATLSVLKEKLKEYKATNLPSFGMVDSHILNKLPVNEEARKYIKDIISISTNEDIKKKLTEALAEEVDRLEVPTDKEAEINEIIENKDC